MMRELLSERLSHRLIRASMSVQISGSNNWTPICERALGERALGERALGLLSSKFAQKALDWPVDKASLRLIEDLVTNKVQFSYRPVK